MAKVEWIKGKFPGIRYRKHPTRKHGNAPDKYFSIRYRVNGLSKEEAVGWASEGWTEAKVAELRAEITSGVRIGAPTVTLAERRAVEAEKQEALKQEAEDAQRTVLNTVFEAFCLANAQVKDLSVMQSRYRNWVAPTIGTKKLEDIRLLDLERIRSRMTKAGKSPQTIKHIKTLVRLVFNYARKHGLYAGALPTENWLTNVRFDNRRMRFLSPDEANMLLTELKNVSITTYRIALLSLSTGMRFGEIAGLKWSHVDTESSRLRVADPKNGQGRTISMLPVVKAMFEELRAEAIAAGIHKPEAIVFPQRGSSCGEKMTAISDAFERAVERLGLNAGITDRRFRVVFHSLRHTAASWMANAGVEIATIAGILGHKTLQMTMRYSHLNDAHIRDAMTALEIPTPETKIRAIGSK